MMGLKKIISIMLILTTSILISCTKMEKNEEAMLDLFDVLKGRTLAKEYLLNISKGDITSANELCDNELISNNVNLSEGVSKLASFQLDETISGNDFSYFIFNVIRDSNVEPKSDLENYIIRVNRAGDKYTISSVKATSKRELYTKNKALRIIGEKGGKSSLVISLNNIPKDTYLRNNKVMLYKEKVPNDNFGKVVLGFTGQKVAISTINEKDAYICVVYIDDTLMESGTDEISPGTPSESASLAEIEDIMEKPVSRKVVSVDLLNNCKIEDFIFSKEDDNLAVNYKNEEGINRLNIYKTEDGELIESNLDGKFSKEVYNVKANYFEDENLNFTVYKNDNSKDNLTGVYDINIKSLEITKL